MNAQHLKPQSKHTTSFALRHSRAGKQLDQEDVTGKQLDQEDVTGKQLDQDDVTSRQTHAMKPREFNVCSDALMRERPHTQMDTRPLEPQGERMYLVRSYARAHRLTEFERQRHSEVFVFASKSRVHGHHVPQRGRKRRDRIY